jgi:Fe-S-cluster containining protein
MAQMAIDPVTSPAELPHCYNQNDGIARQTSHVWQRERAGSLDMAMVQQAMTGMHEAAKVSAGVAVILAEADQDIASRRPVCLSSGRCCQFETYGHRLYVTAAELLHCSLVQAPQSPPARKSGKSDTGATISLPQFFAQDNPEGCPFQVDKLCTAREGRPLGCRVYFCDQNAQSWQSEVYEKYHAQLRALHEKFDIPYRYLEWRAGLREIACPPQG